MHHRECAVIVSPSVEGNANIALSAGFAFLFANGPLLTERITLAVFTSLEQLLTLVITIG
jgi:hypothetical protein